MNEPVQFNEKRKTEIIDGKIYLMASPCDEHINVQDNINNIFNTYFKQNKRRCRAMNESDIRVSKENRYQPDVKILCREKRSDDIPVLIVEVLSKSTQDRDLGIKMKKYAELGVKEYWIITWETSSIAIYLLTEDNKYEFYKSYALFTLEEELERLDENEKKELAREFSPVSFPELIIQLEDVFDIFE
jgi:Uma2 family endonuclease